MLDFDLSLVLYVGRLHHMPRGLRDAALSGQILISREQLGRTVRLNHGSILYEGIPLQGTVVWSANAWLICVVMWVFVCPLKAWGDELVE